MNESGGGAVGGADDAKQAQLVNAVSGNELVISTP